MSEITLSTHARDVMVERSILEEWVWRTINTPGRKRMGEDGNLHYTKAIKEKAGRILHVVINPNVSPRRVVTLFFDRRLSRKTEKRK